jgi:hypothetical protein
MNDSFADIVPEKIVLMELGSVMEGFAAWLDSGLENVRALHQYRKVDLGN